MKWVKLILTGFICFCFFMTAACKEKNEDDFSGVANLISDRNKARHSQAGKSASKKNQIDEKSKKQIASKTPIKKDPLPSPALSKKEVQIIDAQSGSVLGRGTAYINNDGNIVQLKLRR